MRTDRRHSQPAGNQRNKLKRKAEHSSGKIDWRYSRSLEPLGIPSLRMKSDRLDSRSNQRKLCKQSSCTRSIDIELMRMN